MTTQPSSFSPKQEEAIAAIAKVFPRSTVILPRSVAEEHAVSILRALANLVTVNKGKKVGREKLRRAMVETVTEGVMAVGRLVDADNRKQEK